MEFQRITMNEYQTELTEELINSLPQEVQDQLFDIINNVEFVKRLISPTREHAKDRPRDDRGRIIVDLANPHILDYTYTPWLSGVSFWDNIKRFNFFSTIKKWAKKHNPTISSTLKEDSTNIYFMDYV